MDRYSEKFLFLHLKYAIKVNALFLRVAISKFIKIFLTKCISILLELSIYSKSLIHSFVFLS